MNNAALETNACVGRALAVLQQRLHDAQGSISARELAAAADVAEGDAWRLAEELRGLGVELAGTAELGWRLAGDSDLPLSELLAPRIAGTIFTGNIHHFASIASTNAAAMRAGADAEAEGVLPTASHGAVWLAEEQTAGKGRAGHSWKSNPADGIYCSALLRPQLAPVDVIILSLAAGLAVVDAVREVTELCADLRWPNDVLIGGRKFCGILTEMNAEITRVRYVVVGVGLNVNNTEFPPELAPIATSLRMQARQSFSRLELVAALLRALDREHKALCDGAGAAREQILRRFQQHSSFCRGCAVFVEEDGGYQGVTRGLDERGFLRIETAHGMRTVLSGGVRKR